MQRKIGSILSIAGLITVSMTGFSTPAQAQDRQACKDACKALYEGGTQDYWDCVEICSQFNPSTPHGGPGSASSYYKPGADVTLPN